MFEEFSSYKFREIYYINDQHDGGETLFVLLKNNCTINRNKRTIHNKHSAYCQVRSSQALINSQVVELSDLVDH